ncbi:MAG: hypothetical protein Kapaf2KO_06810 [Candidatus Kapaibacteriales bacterium]
MIRPLAKKVIDSVHDFVATRFCPITDDAIAADEHLSENGLRVLRALEAQQTFGITEINQSETLISDCISLMASQAELVNKQVLDEMSLEYDREFTPDRTPLDFVHHLKYNKKPTFGRYLGALLAEKIKEHQDSKGWQYDYIVPVPLSPIKKRERGFNQSEEIAIGIQQAIDIPIYDKMLYRSEYRVSQTRLSAESRAALKKMGIALGRKFDFEQEVDRLEGKRLLIVDDVLTTGNTATVFADNFRPYSPRQIDLAVLVVRGKS